MKLKSILIPNPNPIWEEVAEIYFDTHWGVTIVSTTDNMYSLSDFPEYRDEDGEIFTNPHFGHKVATVVKRKNRRR